MVEGHLSPCLCLSATLIIVFCVAAVHGKDALASGELWAVVILVGSALLCSLVTVIIWRQPESKTKLSFKVSSPARWPAGNRSMGQTLRGLP